MDPTTESPGAGQAGDRSLAEDLCSPFERPPHSRVPARLRPPLSLSRQPPEPGLAHPIQLTSFASTQGRGRRAGLLLWP